MLHHFLDPGQGWLQYDSLRLFKLLNQNKTGLSNCFTNLLQKSTLMNFHSQLRKFYFYGYIIYNVNRYRYIYETCCLMKCDVHKMIMTIHTDFVIPCLLFILLQFQTRLQRNYGYKLSYTRRKVCLANFIFLP